MATYETVVLMGLAGLLLGGAYSLHQQELPKAAWIPLIVLAAMSLIAAYLTRSH